MQPTLWARTNKQNILKLHHIYRKLVNGGVASAMQSAISTRSDAGNLDYFCSQADLPQGGNKTSFGSNEHRDRHDTPHCTSKIKF